MSGLITQENVNRRRRSTEDSAPGCKPQLFPRKLSVRPPCGTVLTGGVRDDLSLIPAFRCTSVASSGYG